MEGLASVPKNYLDIDEFNRLYSLYHRILLNMARKYSIEHYEDIVQEVWEKVYKSWIKYRASCSDSELAMLRQITKTKSIDYLRKWKPREADNTKVDLLYELEVDRTIDIEHLNLKKVIRQVIKEIPDIKMRHIAINKFLKDMDIDDIVDDLEIIGYKLNKKSVSRYIWQLFNLIVKRVKSWKITSEPDVRFELEFELGDND